MSDNAELSELGKAAVWYCEHGFAIVPLKAKSKQPATTHGLNDWFDNPESAREVWTKYPDFNIGIVCGAPSHGLLVLDFDIDEEKDKDGYATLRAWERAQGDLPETAVAITGSGGMHYLYRTDRNNIRPSVNAELSVDVRCDGSYIVAPPSVHPNGNHYEWQDHPEDTPIATANGAVYDFLDHIQRNGGQDETLTVNGKFKLPEKITEKRNTTLHRYASHLRGIGRSDAEIMNAVVGANITRCEPPLDMDEVRRIVRSACKYERGESSDGRVIGVLGAPGTTTSGGGGLVPFRTEKGRILTNELAKNIMNLHSAQYIDGMLGVWNGQRWVFDARAIEWMCLEYADDANSAARTEVVKYIEVRAPHVSSASMSPAVYVQFADCTYDVLNSRVVVPTPDMFITATLPIALDLDAPYGDADRFIESIADGDEPTMRAMMEIIGACMCSKRVLAQSPMLIGRPTGGTSTASNGKSTFINVIRELLGDENVSALDIAALGDRYGPAELVGKLANLGDDIPDGFLKGEELSTFKKMVTGSQLKAERKYHHPFDFKPSATMVFSMNSVPRLADASDGMYRRLAFIPFRRTFNPGDADFDPNIGEKLARPENLQRFAVLGLMALHDLLAENSDRLTVIEDMAEELDEIRRENDIVKRWMWERGISEPRHVVGQWVDDLYRDFTQWCDESGERFAVSRGVFSKKLIGAIGRIKTRDTRDRATGRRGRTYEMV